MSLPAVKSPRWERWRAANIRLSTSSDVRCVVLSKEYRKSGWKLPTVSTPTTMASPTLAVWE